jgi:hypothetical protein
MTPVPIRLSVVLQVEEEELDKPILVRMALTPRSFEGTVPPQPPPTSKSTRRLSKVKTPTLPLDTVNSSNCLLGVDMITELGMWMIDMINDPPTPAVDHGMHPLDWLKHWEEEEIENPKPVLNDDEYEPDLDEALDSMTELLHTYTPTEQSPPVQQPSIQREERYLADVPEDEDEYPDCPIMFLVTDTDEDEHYLIEVNSQSFEVSFPENDDINLIDNDTTAAVQNRTPHCQHGLLHVPRSSNTKKCFECDECCKSASSSASPLDDSESNRVSEDSNFGYATNVTASPNWELEDKLEKERSLTPPKSPRDTMSQAFSRFRTFFADVDGFWIKSKLQTTKANLQDKGGKRRTI